MMLRFALLSLPLPLFLNSISALYINGSITAPCDSPIYCYGDLLAAVELAQPFSDSKTFVDLPTLRPQSEVLAAFDALQKPLKNDTALQTFLTTYFGAAGSEIAPVDPASLNTSATFLNHVSDPVVKDFVNQVIGIWPDLTRRYVGPNASCNGCVDSFIPLNRSFVVAGGRFRESYYWDSFWIVEGLVRTQGSFTTIARNIIENFLDFVELYGFVPNGGRVYYLNRSQPPLLTQMVKVYMQYTNDTSLLERALPILEKEYAFWTNNRTINVTTANGTYALNHYEVQNNQPRPESWREDYITANNASYYSTSGKVYPGTNLTDSQKAQLYQNLASGAESGWDYSSRWLANPEDAVTDTYFPLRSLNTVNVVPVDLNSILYANEITLADFYCQAGYQNRSAAIMYLAKAQRRSEAMYAVMWNETYYSYFDYNLTSKAQNRYIPADADATTAENSTAPAGYQISFSPSQFYPFWTGAAPSFLRDNPRAVQDVYARVETLLNTKNGTIAATNLMTGQQWDQPNAWPPLQYILISGLLNTPPTFGTKDPAYQSLQSTALQLAQRYVASTYCTWRTTGGAQPSVGIQQLANSTGNGTIFEKYADNSTNAAGGGGEYTVVEGFGWSNGVLIWIADTFGTKLVAPQCGNLTAAQIVPSKKRKRSAVELEEYDAKFIRNFRRGA